MSNVSVVENNRLLAEFIEMQSTNIGWFDSESVLRLVYTSDNTFDELLFHSSWDWLMSVVDKIESIGYIFGISGRSCMIVGRNSDTHVFNVSKYGDNKMSSIYECCTSFVKWYNANVK